MSLEDRLQALIRAEVRALTAYPAPQADGLLKLDAMESPYTLPEELKRAWLERLARVAINRYPDASARRLRMKLAATFGVPDDQALMLGNGSDELIQILCLALARPGAVVLAPEPTFVMYRHLALAARCEYCGVPLSETDFSLDEPAMLDAIRERRPAVTFLSWPNNPTGNLFDEDSLDRILAASDGLVVVDEAYHAFARRTALPRVADHDNLLVMRTLSKQGLAGLRLGFMVGRAESIREFEKLRLPYNVNSLTQASVDFLLDHIDVLNDQATLVRQERQVLLGELEDLAGINPWPSEANFILFRSQGRPATEVFEGLKAAGILIKNLHGSHPALEDCLRVTVGTPEENGRFLAVLKELL